MRFPSSAPAAVAALATIVASCGAGDPDDKIDSEGRVPLHPVSGEPALLTLRANPGHGIRVQPDDQPPAEFVAVWPNGTILWSPKAETKGVRCLAGVIPPERVRLAVDVLRKLIDDPALALRNFAVPDSAYDEVILLEEQRMSSIASCAHYFDSNPTAVATDYGIVAVLDGDRDAIVRTRSARFNQFLETWNRCVTEVRNLVPAEGQPTSFPKEGWWDSKTGQCWVIEFPK